MTDSSYRAKNWLMRSDELEDERKRAIGKVLFLESKVNNCVSSYDYTSRRDPISSRAAHEDLLADYVSACDELEDITEKVLHEDNLTIRVMDRMKNKTYVALLFDRYVNRLSWAVIEKSNKYNVKKAQLYRYHREALESLGNILESCTPEIIPTEKLEIEAHEQPIQDPA